MEIYAQLMSHTELSGYHIMNLIKLVYVPETARSALHLIKEFIWGKAKIFGAKDYYRLVGNCLLDNSKNTELHIIISEILKSIEENKSEVRPDIIQEIKKNIFGSMTFEF